MPEGYSGAEDDLPPMALVDMPGYGYAKAPKEQVDLWTKLVFDYLRGRSTLKRVYLLIDSRHGVKKNDEGVMDLLDKAGHVLPGLVLTKTDKIKAAGVPRLMSETLATIKRRPAAYPEVIATSSEKRRRHVRTARGHRFWPSRSERSQSGVLIGGWPEGQGHAVEAMALASGRRPIIEDVTEMTAAAAAVHFGAYGEQRPVFLWCQWRLPRPSRSSGQPVPLSYFGFGGIGRQITAGAMVHALALLVVERTGEGAFRGLLAQHGELLLGQPVCAIRPR